MFMFILYIQGAPTCLCLFYIFKGLQHGYVYVCIFKGLQHVYVYVLYKKTNMKSFEMNKK